MSNFGIQNTQPRTVEITPDRFYKIAALLQKVDPKILTELGEVDRLLLDQYEATDKEIQTLTKSCAALLHDVNASMRRKNQMRSLEEQSRDASQFNHLVEGNHFIAIVHDILSTVNAGNQNLREIVNGLRPGSLLLSKKSETLAQRGFESFDEIQQTLAEIQLNSASVTRFLTALDMLQELPKRILTVIVKAAENMLDGYYQHLLGRHTTKGVPTNDNPILTDLAIVIYENIDHHGEIADGKKVDEISAYTLNKAVVVANALQCDTVKRFTKRGELSEYLKESISVLWKTTYILLKQFQPVIEEFNRATGTRNKSIPSISMIDTALAGFDDTDPMTIVARDSAVLMSREEKFNVEFRNQTLKEMVNLIGRWGMDTKEIVSYVLQRKAELRKFFQDENSFYVCKIGSGNPFGGEAPGALEVIPGPRPLANLDEIVGSGFDHVKKFIGHIERSAKWADLFMATSPSKTTDKSNVLLVGPQGCGKTEVLRAVGSDTSSLSIFAQGSDFLTCWLGEAQKNPKRLFEAGLKLQKESKKHVHFLIDEIDAVLNNDRFERSTVNLSLEFQILMDGVVSYPNLSVWGTTNNPGRIPMPMIRRFAKVLIVGELNGQQRAQLLRHFIDGFLPTKGFEKKDWERFSEMLTGATGDIIRKVADHVWRTSLSEFIEKKPGEAHAMMSKLSEEERFDVSRFDGAERLRFLSMLATHFTVSPEHVEESIKEHLGNIAIQQEIKTAVATYKEAHDFLAQLKVA